MRKFRSFDRSQRFLLPSDLKDRVRDDDLAHFVVEALEARHRTADCGDPPARGPGPMTSAFPPDENRQGKSPKAITAPWWLAMIEKLKTDEAKNKYRRRKSTVEPVFRDD